MQGKQISMKLGEFVGQRLKWVQPHPFRLKYELRAGDITVATLSYPRFFDTFAIASTDEGVWNFKGGNLRHLAVSIRAPGADSDIAVFRTNPLGGGTLELPDGRKYRAILSGVGTEYIIKNEMDEALVRYSNIFTFVRSSAATYINPRAKDLAEISWLAMLGWHLVLVTT